MDEHGALTVPAGNKRAQRRDVLSSRFHLSAPRAPHVIEAQSQVAAERGYGSMRLASLLPGCEGAVGLGSETYPTG